MIFSKSGGASVLASRHDYETKLFSLARGDARPTNQTRFCPIERGSSGHVGMVLKNSRPVKQSIVTLDMEGVLTPEIWIAVAEKTGIKELRRTTRDEPDYDNLMRYRLEILDRHGITL